jgi:hypothetical protein
MTATKHPRSGIERGFLALAAIAIIVFAIFGGAYAIRFGVPVHFAWSRNAEDWEHFGAYLGGVLGPIYGLLAFIGVLITIVLQRQQIGDLRAQSTQQPIQQMLASVSATIDGRLRATPARKLPEIFAPLRRNTVESFLSVGASIVDGIDVKDEEDLAHADWVPEIKRLIGVECVDIALELDHLAACLDAYRAAGGPAAIGDLYKSRYATVVSDLVALDVKLSSRVFKDLSKE